MIRPHKTPTGRWSYRVYLGSVSGKKKYRQVSADTKTECIRLAYELLGKKDRELRRPEKLTVREAITRYIELSATLSPTTLASYRKVRDYAFPDLMDTPVDELTDVKVQQAINAELSRPSKVYGRPLSPKTVKNEYGVVSGALRVICKRSFDVRLPKAQPSHEDLPDPALIMAAIRGSSIELPCLLAMWMSFSMSEIRGIMCSSVRDGFISIDRVDRHEEEARQGARIHPPPHRGYAGFRGMDCAGRRWPYLPRDPQHNLLPLPQAHEGRRPVDDVPRPAARLCVHNADDPRGAL